MHFRIDDRRQHIYAIGQTGTGKTTLLTSLITQDIALGRGTALLDPHGDVAEALLDRISRSRTDQTIYFNPADPKHVPALNLLQPAPIDERPLIAAGVSAWTRKDRYFWSEFTDGATVIGWLRVDSTNWSYKTFVAPEGILAGYPINIETGWIPLIPGAFWTGVVQLDEQVKQERQKAGETAGLYLL